MKYICKDVFGSFWLEQKYGQDQGANSCRQNEERCVWHICEKGVIRPRAMAVQGLNSLNHRQNVLL